MSRRLVLQLSFIAAAVFLFFFLLNSIPLWSSDEGRFGEIAREMLESGNFIIAHFIYVPYLDKPVLAPALTAGFYALFGVSALTTRLVPALSALFGILFVYLFSQRIFDRRTAAYSALLILTTMGYALVGRFAVIDMLMTFWISMTLFCMFLAFREKKPSFYLLAYVFMGLGAMTKGLIGFVIPGFAFLIFLVWSGNLGELKKMKIPLGILIIAVIFLPWLIAACKKSPVFFDAFIVEQHFQRFASGTFGRRRPFWFFIPVFFVIGLPWTFFLPAAAKRGLKLQDEQKPAIRFLISWMAGIILFFSIPKSKLPYYVLPATVPLAILVGNFLARFTSGREQLDSASLKWVWRILAFVGGAGAIGFNIYLFFTREPEIIALKGLGRIGVLLLGAGFISAYVLQKKSLMRGVLCLAGTMYGGLLLTFLGMKMLSPMQSSYDEAQFFKSQSPKPDIIAVFASPDRFSDLPFYLQQRITVTGSDWGTLADRVLEMERKDKSIRNYFWDVFELARRMNAKEERLMVLMEVRWINELREAGLQDGYRTAYKSHDKVILANY